MKHFVTFEGIDGSGKSTIAKLVYKKLKSEGYDVVLTYEPTNSWIGKCVQKCIETDFDPFITSFTFIADRIEHCKQIKKWLDEGKIILCDRYADSTYAYQGVQLENKIKNPIKWLKELSHGRIIIPDRTFLFIIEPKMALARIQHREKLIPFEKVEFLKKVQNNYLKLFNDQIHRKIDAKKSKETLVKITFDEILN